MPIKRAITKPGTSHFGMFETMRHIFTESKKKIIFCEECDEMYTIMPDTLEEEYSYCPHCDALNCHTEN